jgi:protease IV
VAVVVAAGEIVDGQQPPGTVGGDSAADLIRRASRDEQVKALVLRVDSPGGSAFASDVILRELEVFKESGRPLVVSMGSVAASGGYWISMGADEIWASPTTLTGSIGVGATFPTFPRSLDKLGIHVDGLGTTALSGQFDPTRELGADMQQLLRLSIDHAYAEFIDKVAAARNRPPEAVDQVARGRVWTGADALDRGLVDRLGDLDDAVESAAGLAGLEEGEYEVKYIEPELTFAERLALQYAAVLSPLVALLPADTLSPTLRRLLESAAPLSLFERGNDPRGIYAYCFCEVR